MTLITLVLALTMALGLILGLMLRGLLLPREDRRRLNALAAQLVAEQRIDTATRTTLAAMRAAVRQSDEHWPR